MPFSTPQTVAELTYDIGGDNLSVCGGRRFGTLKQRLVGQGASGFLTMDKQLPANSRIVWATLNNRNAITPRAASSAAASNVAIMGVAIVFTAPSSLATNAATSNVILSPVQTAFGASIAANSKARGLAAAVTTAGGITPTSYLYGVGTSPVSVSIVPYASTVATDANGVGRFFVVSATGTSQYTLNGTGTATSGTTTSDFDVAIYFEEYLDTPSAT